MGTREFRALEYRADDGFDEVGLRYEGGEDEGWRVLRDGRPWLELGAGYRMLEVERCGVCSTDLARRFLPFPLPQVIGHELVARDEAGRRVVVEINASHAARGVETACPFCAGGLERHCPERLVLGIHDLPGGFGRFVLAPRHAVLEVPADLPSSTAVLCEPFAAAGNVLADVEAGDSVAVLGPRRLGLLAVAALAAARDAGLDVRVLALSRHEDLCRRARELGADEARRFDGDGAALPDGLADVVVDTTGSPEGLALACRLARRTVHLKSTHGREACGLHRGTALVVDEGALARCPDDDGLAEVARAAALGAEPIVAWLSRDAVPPALATAARVLRVEDPGEALARLEEEWEGTAARPGLPRADLAVVDDLAGADAALRPSPQHERGLVRPRGTVLLRRGRSSSSPLQRAIVERGLALRSSRCGGFAPALARLAAVPDLGEAFVTDELPAARLPEAFARARTPRSVKVVVTHGT
ncbi:MAG: alcohol dehydrogenase catalytic domain-containing protein [Planctomycetota bacterium]